MTDHMSDLEATFLNAWHAFERNAPEPEREYRFCNRLFRFDFAWSSTRVAVECEGAVFTQGRHSRGNGYEHDCEKYNLATALGWRVFRFTSGMLKADPIACVDLVRNAVDGLPVAAYVTAGQVAR